MALPSNLFSHTYQERNLGFLFAALLTILVFIGTLGVGAHIALDRIAGGWNREIETRLTVEIPHPASTDENVQLDRVKRVAAKLQEMPEIEKIAPVTPKETARLLSPWITDEGLLKTLPLPALIDLQLKAGQKIKAEALTSRLKDVAGDIHVESHADWLDRLLRLVGGFTLLAEIAIGLSLFALILIMSLVCLALVALQKDTLSLLKLLGASESELSAEFQRHAAWLAFPAAFLGAAAAAGTLAGTSLLFERFLGVPLLTGVNWVPFGLGVVTAPLVGCFITLITARFVVYRLLCRLP